MMKAWQYLQTNGDIILYAVILLVVLILFLRDFDLTNKRSWAILLGLSALGAVLFVKGRKNKQLLAELRKRKEALQNLEKEYEDLKKEFKVSDEKHKEALKNLEEAKRKAANDILTSEENLKTRVEEINKEYQNKSADELLQHVESILKK